MSDLMRHGRMLAEAVREKSRLERELSIVTARINTLAAEITSIVDETAVILALTDETRVLQTVRPYVSESAGASAAENRRKGRAEMRIDVQARAYTRWPHCDWAQAMIRSEDLSHD